MIRTTLVTGGRAGGREAAVAAALESGIDTAVIVEGFPEANCPLSSSATLKVARIGAACPCCSGNLIFGVTLNRILRHPPQRLFISLADASHIEQMRSFLCQAPYDKLLWITQDIRV